MRTERIAGHTVEIYDAIDELPIDRWHKYNKFMLVDSGVGSDLRDVNNHIAKINAYMKKDLSLAARELENLRQNFYMITQEMSPKYLAFAALVKSIDGVEQFDLRDENMKRINKMLSREKFSVLEGLLEVVKKKLMPS